MRIVSYIRGITIISPIWGRYQGNHYPLANMGPTSREYFAFDWATSGLAAATATAAAMTWHLFVRIGAAFLVEARSRRPGEASPGPADPYLPGPVSQVGIRVGRAIVAEAEVGTDVTCHKVRLHDSFSDLTYISQRTRKHQPRFSTAKAINT